MNRLDRPSNSADPDPPSDAAVSERAKSLCNEALFTIALQCRRIRSIEPEDNVFVMRPWADLQFLIVALRRLRRSAQILRKHTLVAQAIRDFDSALPGINKMRNVGEHIDDYAVDNLRRHHPEITRKDLQTGSWDETVFKWLGYELNMDTALNASEKLFEAVKACARQAMRTES